MLLIDDTRSFIIEKIFRDLFIRVQPYLSHKNVKELGFTLTGNGAVFRVLNNPSYAGLISSR